MVFHSAVMAYLDNDFFLHSPTAQRLFHEVAKDQPTEVGRALAQLGIEHPEHYPLKAGVSG